LTEVPLYTISVNNQTLDGWQKLCASHPEEMDALKLFLKKQPDNLRVTNGKAKKLKGRLKQYIQYDVTYSHRVWYRIDKKNGAVIVDYAGPHP
jgi:mRNA-degrading endonuclease RelE of RelBE toxin-antitoxin system